MRWLLCRRFDHYLSKSIDISAQTDGVLYLIVEFMLESIRQFFAFEESLRTANPDFPGEFHTRMRRQDLQPYFASLEMLRGHLFRCLTQIAVIADIEIPKIYQNTRYDCAWQLEAYQKPKHIEEGGTQQDYQP